MRSDINDLPLDQQLAIQKIPTYYKVEGLDLAPINVKSATIGVYNMFDFNSSRDDFKDRDLFLLPVEKQKNLNTLTSQYIIHPLIQQTTQFRRANLRDHTTYNQSYNVIFCRNVLMYNDKETRQKVTRNLINALNAGGYIFFAPTDFPEEEVLTECTAVESSLNIYRKKDE